MISYIFRTANATLRKHFYFVFLSSWIYTIISFLAGFLLPLLLLELSPFVSLLLFCIVPVFIAPLLFGLYRIMLHLLTGRKSFFSDLFYYYRNQLGKCFAVGLVTRALPSFLIGISTLILDLSAQADSLKTAILFELVVFFPLFLLLFFCLFLAPYMITTDYYLPAGELLRQSASRLSGNRGNLLALTLSYIGISTIIMLIYYIILSLGDSLSVFQGLVSTALLLSQLIFIPFIRLADAQFAIMSLGVTSLDLSADLRSHTVSDWTAFWQKDQKWYRMFIQFKNHGQLKPDHIERTLRTADPASFNVALLIFHNGKYGIYPFLAEYPTVSRAVWEAYQTAFNEYRQSAESPPSGRGICDFIQNNNRFRITVSLAKALETGDCLVTSDFLVNP